MSDAPEPGLYDFIQSANIKGDSVSIDLGSNKVKDLSDGEFPLELWRIRVFTDERTKEEHMVTCVNVSTLTKNLKKAGSGWIFQLQDQWVEIRTPSCRVPKNG